MIIKFQSEIPVGLINGSNTSYTVQNEPVQLFQNGQFQVSGIDYIVTGTSSPFTLTYATAPTAGNHISLY